MHILLFKKDSFFIIIINVENRSGLILLWNLWYIISGIFVE